ncbi:MAG TPA: polysaccharide deacetylase family protein [Terriglobales bacterium]|nr:polysaccharide deacetylase family protein [Terriglobales bacterium]
MLKSRVKKLLVESGATRVVSRFAKQGVAILMYHSVTDKPEAQEDSLGGIGHPTQMFRNHMESLAREYHPVNLEEIVRFIQGRGNLPRRSVAITFDDGYADNYEVALPILNRIGIPAAFYVTVACVQKRILPWPARVRYALFTTRKTDWVDPDGGQWTLRDSTMRRAAFDKACEYCSKKSGAEQDKFVACLESQLETALIEGPSMMTWDEVRAVAKQGHIIGSHTMTHPNMAHIDDEALNREFTESKQILERELASPVVHFSYPCPALQPHWTEQTVNLSRACGYQSAVTTSGGTVRRDDNPLQLKRVRPTKDVAGLRANLEMAFLGRRS